MSSQCAERSGAEFAQHLGMRHRHAQQRLGGAVRRTAALLSVLQGTGRHAQHRRNCLLRQPHLLARLGCLRLLDLSGARRLAALRLPHGREQIALKFLHLRRHRQYIEGSTGDVMLVSMKI